MAFESARSFRFPEFDNSRPLSGRPAGIRYGRTGSVTAGTANASGPAEQLQLGRFHVDGIAKPYTAALDRVAEVDLERSRNLTRIGEQPR
jgi:hypothetical protein